MPEFSVRDWVRVKVGVRVRGSEWLEPSRERVKLSHMIIQCRVMYQL